MYSEPPNSVSRLFGKLEASRHLISGMVCAIAGAAIVAAPAAPSPAVFKKARRLTAFELRMSWVTIPPSLQSDTGLPAT
ncbi:MAG: hypothetical protein WDO24_10685 [Pseudomonadota bacterium]